MNDRVSRLLEGIDKLEHERPDGAAVRAAMRAHRLGEFIPNPALAKLAALLCDDIDAIRALESDRIPPATN